MKGKYMFKKFSVLLLAIAVIMVFSTAKATVNNKSLEISNNYFSFTLPAETNGTYTVNKENNGIFICEKISS